MDRDEANIAKRELCEKLLAPGTVMLVIDTRREGVSVPSNLAGKWRDGLRPVLSSSPIPLAVTVDR